MSKLLKIGIPILVAVLVLVIGAGLVLAKEKDTSVLNCPYASYDCSQCPGQQYTNCPFAGNDGGWGGCGGGGYCAGPGAVYGPGGLYDDNDASYQSPCHRYWR
ncbi:MAG: hypothetical protein H8E40_07010 [Chloroflexi bacterium]|nr:hypothetical protein [Chloroflexota bacterium]MBL7061645.1 hypothetical protein [Dehalococcoidia bacterium]